MSSLERQLREAQSEINRLKILLREAESEIEKLRTKVDVAKDTTNHELTGRLMSMADYTPVEAKVVALLYENYPDIVPYSRFISAYANMEVQFENNIKVHISRIRRKISGEIYTYTGVGYSLSEEAFLLIKNYLNRSFSAPIEESVEMNVNIHNLTRPPLPRG